jgi:hypothetical protein
MGNFNPYFLTTARLGFRQWAVLELPYQDPAVGFLAADRI